MSQSWNTIFLLLLSMFLPLPSLSNATSYFDSQYLILLFRNLFFLFFFPSPHLLHSYWFIYFNFSVCHCFGLHFWTKVHWLLPQLQSSLVLISSKAVSEKLNQRTPFARDSYPHEKWVSGMLVELNSRVALYVLQRRRRTIDGSKIKYFFLTTLPKIGYERNLYYYLLQRKINSLWSRKITKLQTSLLLHGSTSIAIDPIVQVGVRL